MMTPPPLARLLADIERELAALPAAELPGLLGELERLKALAWPRLLGGADGRNPAPSPEGDRLLTAEEVAKLFSVKRRWLRDHGNLPFVRRISPKVVRYSETGIRRWLATKRS